MLVWRSSCRAVRLAEALTAPRCALFMAPRPSTRLSSVSPLQLLSCGPQSRRNRPANGPISWRSFSSSSPSQGAKEKEDEEMERLQQRGTALSGQIVYEGPMNRAVRLMKGVSVTSCILTSVGMPMLCVLSEQDASIVGKWAMCGTIMLFGLGTTSLFHYLFKPYVLRMWLADPAAGGGASAPTIAGQETQDDSTLTVETVTLFAQLTQHSFRLSEVAPPEKSMHPMQSFQARGRHFFIHPEEFQDRQLLEKLVRNLPPSQDPPQQSQ